MAVAWAPSAAAQTKPTFPALSGRIVDEAGLLSPETKAALTEKLAALEAKTSDQLVIVTLNSLNDYDIADYGYQLGREWGVGQSETNNGVLLIIAPNERKVRIEVGYGLEHILTDGFSHLVIQNDILPDFREDAFEAGIVKGTDALIEQMELDPEEAKARALAADAASDQDPAGYWAIILLAIIFIGILVIGASGGRGGRRLRDMNMSDVLVWIAAEAAKSAAENDDGGGWGGGGGSFGGGGASGSW